MKNMITITQKTGRGTKKLNCSYTLHSLIASPRHLMPFPSLCFLHRIQAPIHVYWLLAYIYTLSLALVECKLHESDLLYSW